jgi:proline iminopeptidase
MSKILSYLLILFLSADLAASSPQQERIVEVRGAKLFCRIMGAGDPLIVLHGGPGLSQDYLLPYMQRLAEHRLVVFCDQRGCGKSENGGGEAFLRPEEFVEDLEALRLALGYEKISILGHSWGGFLGMRYAIAHPRAVDALILLNSIPASSEDVELFLQEWARRMAPFMEEFQQIARSEAFAAGDPGSMSRYLRLMFRTYCADGRHADALQLTLSPEASRNFLLVSQAFRNIWQQPFDLRADLKRLPCKTLIIHGDQDPIPPSTAHAIHESIPGSQLVILQDCGHFPYVEKPQELFALLEAFLKNP